jgi:hypothetical protein
MATRALPYPSTRHPALVYECDSQFGEYIYSETIRSWINRRAESNGREFSVLGRGRQPSPAQHDLWRSLEPQIEQLTADAIGAVLSPPLSVETGKVGALQLRQIRLELDGSVNIILGSDAIDQSTGLALMVTFVNGSVSESRWIV